MGHDDHKCNHLSISSTTNYQGECRSDINTSVWDMIQPSTIAMSTSDQFLNSSSASQSTTCNMLIVMGENLATQFYLSKHFWLIYPFLQSTHLGSLGQCNTVYIIRANHLYEEKERNWIVHLEQLDQTKHWTADGIYLL